MANFLSPILGVFGLGGTELIIILLVVLLLFGGKKLPELAKGLGKSVKEFKKASEQDDEDEAAKAKPAAEAKKADPAHTPGSN